MKRLKKILGGIPPNLFDSLATYYSKEVVPNEIAFGTEVKRGISDSKATVTSRIPNYRRLLKEWLNILDRNRQQ